MSDIVERLRDCAFCAIVSGEAPAQIIREWDDAVAFVPLNPVTNGHVLVVPREHVTDALHDPDISAATMRRATEIAPFPCNIITSAGAAATQTIHHLHLHIVPRRMDDDLSLPWDQRRHKPGGDGT